MGRRIRCGEQRVGVLFKYGRVGVFPAAVVAGQIVALPVMLWAMLGLVDGGHGGSGNWCRRCGRIWRGIDEADDVAKAR